MIKEYAIRHYLFKCVIKNVRKDLRELSAIIYSNLQNTFLVKEEVILNNREGLIVKIVKDEYYVVIKNDWKTVKCKFDELIRKHRLDRNSIFDTLNFITYETPLGVRLLKKNIYGYATDKSSIKDYLIYLKKNPGSKFLENFKESEASAKKIPGDDYINARYVAEDDRNLFINGLLPTDSSIILSFKSSENNIIPPESILPASSRPLVNSFHHHENSSQNDIREDNNVDITLSIPKSEIYEIPEFEFKYVNKILRIYSFIYNFCPNKVLTNVNINKLVKSFKETSYISDIIGAIHGFLIENLLEEKKAIGLNNLLDNVKSVIDSISDNFVSDDIHIGNEVGMRGWKLKSRMLLLEIYKKTNNTKILNYYNVLNKKSPFEIEDTVKLRISLVEFFINCYMATNLFRDIILNETKKVQSLEQKAIELSKYYKVQSEDLSNSVSLKDIGNKLSGIKKKVVLSPTKADIGQLNGANFFLVNDEIFMSKNSVFYVPSKNTIKAILEKYNPIDRTECITINNLRNILESIYINKL